MIATDAPAQLSNQLLELPFRHFLNIQQFAFKLATNKNIKPIAGLRPATLFVAGLIYNCCNALSSHNLLDSKI